jgi:hypothetical protein
MGSRFCGNDKNIEGDRLVVPAKAGTQFQPV